MTVAPRPRVNLLGNTLDDCIPASIEKHAIAMVEAYATRRKYNELINRGYCLEMMCGDFLAGAISTGGRSLPHFFQFLPGEQKLAIYQLIVGT